MTYSRRKSGFSLSNSEYVRSRIGRRDLITRSRHTPVDWLIVRTLAAGPFFSLFWGLLVALLVELPDFLSLLRG